MNSFGRLFRVSIFGESHGPAVGIVIDGCPAGIPLSEEDFENDLSRRRSGAKGTTSRKEPDLPNIVSGVYNKHTTGVPLTIMFANTNARSRDYEALKHIPRPGHADFTASKKYDGFQDPRGGGHFSGRLTLAITAAGVIAKKIISPINIEATIIEAGGDKNIRKAVDRAVEQCDSIGGVIQCSATNVPIGLGEPFFDSLEALVSHMMFSIPAIKGIEFGSGFQAATMFGSQHNDRFIATGGKTATNHAGGINGGIANGNEIVFRVAVKPTPSISIPQETINTQSGDIEQLVIEGRHDACIALRVPVVAEAGLAIVLADLLLIAQ